MPKPNADQAQYWSSLAGRKWITHQNELDTLLAPVLDALLDVAKPRPGENVLDIGCGTGASTRELSTRVGRTGQVTALDISPPLLDLARIRATDPNVSIIEGDAQTYVFAEQSDLVFSRFGVMFFDDPVAAFANLLGSVRLGGRLAIICWQGMPENPWFQVPFDAAVAQLGRPSKLDPHAPGPTAFKDVDRVTGILADAGWSDAAGDKIEVNLIPPQDVMDAAAFATTVGPAARTLDEKGGTEKDAAAITETCAKALKAYVTDEGLRVPARLIIYTATNAG